MALVTNSAVLKAKQLKSTTAAGVAPIIVASNTLVVGLNADLLDGFEAAALAKLAGAAFTGLVTAGAGVSITGGAQAQGTIVKASGSGLVATAIPGTLYDLALVNAAITDYLLANPTGTPDVRIALNGVTLFGPATQKTGASAGETVLKNATHHRAVTNAGTGTFRLIGGSSSDQVSIDQDAKGTLFGGTATVPKGVRSKRGDTINVPVATPTTIVDLSTVISAGGSATWGSGIKVYLADLNATILGYAEIGVSNSTYYIIHQAFALSASTFSLSGANLQLTQNTGATRPCQYALTLTPVAA